MITVSAYIHETPSGPIIELGDIAVCKLSKGEYICESDFALIRQSLDDIYLDKFTPEEWYEFTFKRTYDDDGSGSITDLWFELIKIRLVK